ncbi:hypothetical protein K0H71_19100 [Bacillus sp. IITD106]|nr:hypothetical protein [Bacillus sp. IITD106]
MEEKTLLQEILTAFRLHAEHIDKRFDEIDKRFEQVDKRFAQMDKRFDEINTRLDRMEKKHSGMRVEVTEAHESINYLANKVIQHDRKIRELQSQS